MPVGQRVGFQLFTENQIPRFGLNDTLSGSTLRIVVTRTSNSNGWAVTPCARR